MGLVKRRFMPGVPNHCYQNTVNGDLIFYCICDYLVCFTHICTAAMRYGITVLSLTLMPDHLHGNYLARSREVLSGFIRDYTGPFTYRYNQICNRKRQLFNRHFGSAPKMGDKSIRTNLVYLGNNPVERKLTVHAEEYRWNFLAYYKNPNPFSKKLVLRRVSQQLRRAVAEVKACRKDNKPLSYNALKRMMSPLTQEEKQQITDFIITAYNVIDYETAIGFFGSYEEMIDAMHITTGNEYDINEVFVGRDDRVYAKMVNMVMEEVRPADIHEILTYSLQGKKRLYNRLLSIPGATKKQVEKFLWMPTPENGGHWPW
jgi:hypothetical protein